MRLSFMMSLRAMLFVAGSSFEPNKPTEQTQYRVYLRILESENDLEKKTQTLKGLSLWKEHGNDLGSLTYLASFPGLHPTLFVSYSMKCTHVLQATNTVVVFCSGRRE